MTHYSYAQIEQLWIQAGGSPSMAPLMAAIAEAESGGDSNATGGVGEKGLWQINPHAWGSLATYDPMGNAKAAVHVLAVQGLGAWTTYTNHAYKAHLQGNVPPGTGALPGGGSGGGTSATLTSSPGGVSGGISSAILPGGFGSIFSGILGAAGVPQTDTGSIASDIYTFIKMVAWLYNPANWVRIGAFVAGVILLAGAGWMFKESI